MIMTTVLIKQYDRHEAANNVLAYLEMTTRSYVQHLARTVRRHRQDPKNTQFLTQRYYELVEAHVERTMRLALAADSTAPVIKYMRAFKELCI